MDGRGTSTPRLRAAFRGTYMTSSASTFPSRRGGKCRKVTMELRNVRDGIIHALWPGCMVAGVKANMLSTESILAGEYDNHNTRKSRHNRNCAGIMHTIFRCMGYIFTLAHFGAFLRLSRAFLRRRQHSLTIGQAIP